MKKHALDFLHRGLIAGNFGPLILAVVYLILKQAAAVEALTVEQVCTGILSLWALAFVAGGMNAIYQVERLPLMAAVLIHGSVLYVGYLGTYLLNNWLAWSATPVLVFSAIFLLGYLAVWAIIYAITKRRTRRLNEILRKKQTAADF
jgi:hypothetical protein